MTKTKVQLITLTISMSLSFHTQFVYGQNLFSRKKPTINNSQNQIKPEKKQVQIQSSKLDDNTDSSLINTERNTSQNNQNINPEISNTRLHRPENSINTKNNLEPDLAKEDNPLPLLNQTQPSNTTKEKYPSIAQLEQLMFGHSTPNIIVDNRLDKLELSIFQKSYPDLDIEQRILKLKEIIIGDNQSNSKNKNYQNNKDYTDDNSKEAYLRDLQNSNSSSSSNPNSNSENQSAKIPFYENLGHYDLNQLLTPAEAEKFGLEVINEVRSQQGSTILSWDDTAFKVAEDHITDLTKRDAVSHQDSNGHNPDLRYTGAGGSDCLIESVIMFAQAHKLRPTRQLIVKMLETLNNRQDDREAFAFSHATGFAMAFGWTADRKRLICCTEIVTKHGDMDPIPAKVNLGDKIELHGTISAPYRFHKITIAWEGSPNGPPDDIAEADEALPYFPPLDYEAHAARAERDYDKGIKMLQIAGITAAIAGGLFIPPVAMAAPLIAATVGPTMPKQVSEIPIRGGVKTDGTSFLHSITVNNKGKEGIYYITIWAKTGSGQEMLPISRRAILVSKDNQEKVENGSEKQETEKKVSNDNSPSNTNDTNNTTDKIASPETAKKKRGWSIGSGSKQKKQHKNSNSNNTDENSTKQETENTNEIKKNN